MSYVSTFYLIIILFKLHQITLCKSNTILTYLTLVINTKYLDSKILTVTLLMLNINILI